MIPKKILYIVFFRLSNCLKIELENILQDNSKRKHSLRVANS